MKKILLVLENDNKTLGSVNYECFSVANLIKEITGFEICALLIGSDLNNLASELSRTTGYEVYLCETLELDLFNPEVTLSAIEYVQNKLEIAYFICPHTTQGLDFAPALACTTDSACVTGVEGIEEKNGIPHFIRAIAAGKLSSAFSSTTQSTVVTIQPGVFRPLICETKHTEKVVSFSYTGKPPRTKSLGIKSTTADSTNLKEASTVVAIGRGIGDESNIELVQKLADLFTKSAVAGSRPLCDLGWLKYGQQVGITGASISPELYLSCGISGTTQHTQGIKGSKLIVSINLDPNAIIFNHSDYCIVEDIDTFIPLLLEEYEKWKAEQA